MIALAMHGLSVPCFDHDFHLVEQVGLDTYLVVPVVPPLVYSFHYRESSA